MEVLPYKADCKTSLQKKINQLWWCSFLQTTSTADADGATSYITTEINKPTSDKIGKVEHCKHF